MISPSIFTFKESFWLILPFLFICFGFFFLQLGLLHNLHIYVKTYNKLILNSAHAYNPQAELWGHPGLYSFEARRGDIVFVSSLSQMEKHSKLNQKYHFPIPRASIRLTSLTRPRCFLKMELSLGVLACHAVLYSGYDLTSDIPAFQWRCFHGITLWIRHLSTFKLPPAPKDIKNF